MDPIIVAADVICAAGSNLDEAWGTISKGAPSLSRNLERFLDGDSFQNYPFGFINAAVWKNLREEYTEFFGSPNFAESPAPNAGLLARIVGHRILQNLPRENLSLVLATTKGEIRELENNINQATFAGDLHRFTKDLAVHLKISDPPRIVSHACASGLSAVIEGIRRLEKGPKRPVLIVAVDIISRFVATGFNSLQAIDPNGCQPFSADRRGITLGEGAAAALLVPSGDVQNYSATNNWKPIKIQGWGETSDAFHVTRPDSSGDGLYRAIEQATTPLKKNLAAIQFINAHGTGTVANDAMESAAIAKALAGRDHSAPLVTSLKPLIGHTLGAAGLIELILTGKMLSSGRFVSTLGLKKADPSLADLNFLNVPPQNQNSKALTLKSGFGGMNTAVLLEKFSD